MGIWSCKVFLIESMDGVLFFFPNRTVLASSPRWIRSLLAQRICAGWAGRGNQRGHTFEDGDPAAQAEGTSSACRRSLRESTRRTSRRGFPAAQCRWRRRTDPPSPSMKAPEVIESSSINHSHPEETHKKKRRRKSTLRLQVCKQGSARLQACKFAGLQSCKMANCMVASLQVCSLKASKNLRLQAGSPPPRSS